MEKLKFLFMAFLTFLLPLKVFPQTSTIIHEGQIEFQRRLNAYSILNNYYSDPLEEPFAQQYKNSKPQFGITNHILIFNDSLTLYSPNNKIPNIPEVSLLMMQNIVQNNLTHLTSISKKKAVDDEFLIIDSTRKIKWKLTEETRQIAGFGCRRANGILMDSLYVVAFYTDQIAPRGGPESFSGLPGMILGVVLPNEHVSWFATHVNSSPISNEQLQPPKGGKRVNYNEFLEILKSNPLLKVNTRLKELLIRNYSL